MQVEQRRFVTLTRSDEDFADYLLGKGPDGLRALPVESFAINSPRERVTFALVAPEKIKRPAWLTRYVLALRLELLPLTLAPLLVSWAAIWVKGGQLAFFKVIFMLINIVALHAAAFTRNDYEDHLHGIDRIQRRRGSQVIQRGWLSALEVRNISRAALLVSVIAGLPLLWPPSADVVLLGSLGLAAVLGYGFAGRGFKNQGVGDVVVGLCMGPLLTLGVGKIFAAEEALWLACVGLPLGLGAVIVFQLRQLETIMTERQSGAGTMMARLGFDRAKRWLQMELWFLPIFTTVALWAWVPTKMALLLTALVALGQLPLQRRLRRIASPLSSDLLGLARHALWFYMALAGALILTVGAAG
ncbi:MAG: prenyltransferase [Bdellovibrionales bacterium]